MRTAPVRTARPSRLKAALRWLPTFVGFPLGGLAAEFLVGPVDGLGPAIAGGAVTGAVLGVIQWLGLRRARLSPERWLLATAAGLAVGLGVGAAAVGYGTSMGALAVQGAISGAAVGLAQATVLHRRLGRLVWVWPVVVAAAWALGWTITTAAGIDVESQYTVFGSSGAIAVTAITSVLAVALAER
jgi:hypothetical protein